MVIVGAHALTYKFSRLSGVQGPLPELVSIALHDQRLHDIQI